MALAADRPTLDAPGTTRSLQNASPGFGGWDEEAGAAGAQADGAGAAAGEGAEVQPA